ncbi:hypothetical protein SmJEL517_g04415 [Synchytrium microbalum]|uniref:HTH La-type RNA-binding domain-containing protein n=1 Tax=Synchytrium microbalum TaxID=1806994 RepID=A0A507BS06_9FUNG|nr:uncharacterized protein SmJEL517_g04415 [Synchytrium microbalum]TPX32430.1 hypothetical protein SmJEL517_g04415 [Synchytrium microbalum]
MDIDPVDDGFLPAVNTFSSGASPAESLHSKVLSLLLAYTSESEAKSLLQQVRSSQTYYHPEHIDGYIPISLLLSFKKMQKLTQDLHLIAQIAATSRALQVHADGTKIRRVTSITTPAAPPAGLSSSAYITAYKFESDTVKPEVALYFANFGVVVDVDFIKPGVAGIKFSDDAGLVNAITAPHHRFRGDALHVEWIASSHLDMLEGKGRIPKNKKKVNYPRRLAGPYPYTCNRILHVDVSGLCWDAIDDASELDKAAATVTTLLEPYAHVVGVSLERAGSAYVRFKQPIVDDLPVIIERSGGIYWPDNDLLLPVRVVKGDEERVYWHVTSAREAKGMIARRRWTVNAVEAVSTGTKRKAAGDNAVDNDSGVDENGKQVKRRRGPRVKSENEPSTSGVEDVLVVQSSVQGAKQHRKKKMNGKKQGKRGKKAAAAVISTPKPDLADMLNQLL